MNCMYGGFVENKDIMVVSKITRFFSQVIVVQIL